MRKTSSAIAEYVLLKIAEDQGVPLGHKAVVGYLSGTPVVGPGLAALGSAAMAPSGSRSKQLTHTLLGGILGGLPSTVALATGHPIWSLALSGLIPLGAVIGQETAGYKKQPTPTTPTTPNIIQIFPSPMSYAAQMSRMDRPEYYDDFYGNESEGDSYE